jgi:hypothetical protein
MYVRGYLQGSENGRVVTIGSKRGPKRRFTDSERKHRKRESNAKLSNLSRIWIGDQCDRWNELRSVLRVKTNTEVVKILLD